MGSDHTSQGKVLAASTIGVAFGLSAVTNASFGAFILPLSHEFAWPRGNIAFAATIFQMFNILMAPLVGILIDRIGVRKVIIASVSLYGAVLACLSLLSGAIWQLYLGYAMLAIVGIGTASISYCRLILSWFTEKRGLALGTMLAGMGISVSGMPYLVSVITGFGGWRMAYIALGILTMVAVLPFVISWAWDKRPPGVDGGGARGAEEELPGLSFREAVRSRTFLLMMFAFTLVGTLAGAIPTHLMPLLVEHGVPPLEASIYAITLGVSFIIGRIATGYLLDRLFGPALMVVVILMAAAGLVMMLSEVKGAWLILSIFMMGFTIGADGDFMSYLLSRYFGLRAFTRLYGLLFAAFALGTGCGPAIMGFSANVSGRYDLALEILIGITLLSMLPFPFLGRYPADFQADDGGRGH